jgi:hypothetical protein
VVGKVRNGNERKRRGEKIVFPQLSFGLFGRDLETSRSPATTTKNKSWLPADTSSREIKMGIEKNKIYRNCTCLPHVRARGASPPCPRCFTTAGPWLPFVVATAPPIVLAVFPSSRPLVDNFFPFLSSPSSSPALAGAIAGAGACGRQRLTSRALELQFRLTISPRRSARRPRRTRRSGSAMRCAHRRGHHRSWCTATR